MTDLAISHYMYKYCRRLRKELLTRLSAVQEVFHVCLNKFENAATHLFLVILGNNLFPWVNLISRNTQSSKENS